jgi:hypothetical protein
LLETTVLAGNILKLERLYQLKDSHGKILSKQVRKRGRNHIADQQLQLLIRPDASAVMVVSAWLRLIISPAWADRLPHQTIGDEWTVLTTGKDSFPMAGLKVGAHPIHTLHPHLRVSMLPCINGREVGHIRRLLRRRRRPVVLIVNDREAGAAAGSTLYHPIP